MNKRFFKIWDWFTKNLLFKFLVSPEAYEPWYCKICENGMCLWRNPTFKENFSCPQRTECHTITKEGVPAKTKICVKRIFLYILRFRFNRFYCGTFMLLYYSVIFGISVLYVIGMNYIFSVVLEIFEDHKGKPRGSPIVCRQPTVWETLTNATRKKYLIQNSVQDFYIQF